MIKMGIIYLRQSPSHELILKKFRHSNLKGLTFGQTLRTLKYEPTKLLDIYEVRLHVTSAQGPKWAQWPSKIFQNFEFFDINKIQGENSPFSLKFSTFRLQQLDYLSNKSAITVDEDGNYPDFLRICATSFGTSWRAPILPRLCQGTMNGVGWAFGASWGHGWCFELSYSVSHGSTVAEFAQPSQASSGRACLFEDVI